MQTHVNNVDRMLRTRTYILPLHTSKEILRRLVNFNDKLNSTCVKIRR